MRSLIAKIATTSESRVFYRFLHPTNNLAARFGRDSDTPANDFSGMLRATLIRSIATSRCRWRDRDANMKMSGSTALAVSDAVQRRSPRRTAVFELQGASNLTSPSARPAAERRDQTCARLGEAEIVFVQAPLGFTRIAPLLCASSSQGRCAGSTRSCIRAAGSSASLLPALSKADAYRTDWSRNRSSPHAVPQQRRRHAQLVSNPAITFGASRLPLSVTIPLCSRLSWEVWQPLALSCVMSDVGKHHRDARLMLQVRQLVGRACNRRMRVHHLVGAPPRRTSSPTTRGGPFVLSSGSA